MRDTFLLLTYMLVLLFWGQPCEAQKPVLGSVTRIDSEHARAYIETRSTLFGNGGEEEVLDLSQLKGESWDKLQPGDSIRAWTEAPTSPSATPIVRSMQSWSQRAGDAADLTGVRRRLSHESAGSTGRSMRSVGGMGGSRSGGGRSSGGGRR
jgi:uncharacterized membrane protein YgcG